MELKEIIDNAKQINDMLIQDIKDNDETVLNALSENYHEDYQKVEQDFNKALQSVEDPLNERFDAFDNLVRKYNWKAAQKKLNLKKTSRLKKINDLQENFYKIAEEHNELFHKWLTDMLNAYELTEDEAFNDNEFIENVKEYIKFCNLQFAMEVARYLNLKDKDIDKIERFLNKSIDFNKNEFNKVTRYTDILPKVLEVI
jgi:predicted  nucleic acid-binding Zn-ribbon protein